MATMTVWNKGKRSWLKANMRGLTADIGPNESAELDEALARRLVMDYPQDFSLSGRAMPSSDELARREQSIRDREANLDKREAELDARENAIKERENNSIDASDENEKPAESAGHDTAPEKGKPGRKPKQATGEA